jgi:cobalt-zinc-cadmium resistance protein CzcA
VAVLNGIVLISEFNSLKKEGMSNIQERILKGTHTRLRPVIMTASVASLGFLPMAISTSAGAEVQRPLATVVIGGLVTATLLTLLVLPILYYYLEKGIRVKPQALVILLALASIFATAQPLQAQEQPAIEALSLDEAIRVALQNHPAMQKANLQVEQQEALKKTAFDFEQTSLFHQREETNGEEFPGISSYGVQQNIDFPTTYLRKYAFQQEKVNQSLLSRDISANQLIAQVSQAYNAWLLAESRLRLVQRQDSIFRNFESAAQLRFETGATGKLEYLSATSQARQVSVLLEQVQADYQAATQSLKSWLNVDAEIASAEEGLYKFEEPLLAAPGNLVQNPQLAYYAQNREIAEAATKVERSKFLPGFSLGYSDQTVNDREGFFQYRVGLNVPLLFFAQKGRTQAVQLQQVIAEKELQEQEQALERQLATARAALQKAAASLRFYEEEGLQLAEEQIRAAQFGYEQGAVEYIAFIQNLAQAITIQENYLNSLQQYNLAVIELNSLSGELLENYDPSTNP